MLNQYLTAVEIEPTSATYWLETIRIYCEAFPAWEREPEKIIAKRVTEGRYRLNAGIVNEKVIGFYLMDLNPEPRYAALCFLAVDVQHRGKGWGTLLCQDAVRYYKNLVDFPWLFIEAQERQAAYYGRIGFLKLVLEYQMPHFNGPGSLPMHLMVLPNKPPPASIRGSELAAILRNLFVQGYQLNSDDPRIAEQLARVENNVELITWPEDDDT